MLSIPSAVFMPPQVRCDCCLLKLAALNSSQQTPAQQTQLPCSSSSKDPGSADKTSAAFSCSGWLTATSSARHPQHQAMGSAEHKPGRRSPLLMLLFMFVIASMLTTIPFGVVPRLHDIGYPQYTSIHLNSTTTAARLSSNTPGWPLQHPKGNRAPRQTCTLDSHGLR
jgi:hypothetical protein